MTQKIKAKIHAQEPENQQRPYLLCDSALPLPVALSPLRSRELGLLIPVLTISMLTGHYQRPLPEQGREQAGNAPGEVG